MPKLESKEFSDKLEEILSFARPAPDPKKEWARVPQWDMANAHWCFMTALTQAYKHAGDAPQSDAHNYLNFVRALITAINQHHEVEESTYFPYLEKKMPMDAAVEQHKVFHEGLVDFLAYLDGQLEKASKGDKAPIEPEKIREHIDSFAWDLIYHLREELDMFDPERFGSLFTQQEQEEVIKKVLDEILKHDMTTFMPLCLTNNYVGDGYHWPPVPWPVRYLVGPLFIGFKSRPFFKYSAHGFYNTFPA